jgi:WXXGXW repeat (2 copies)
MTQNTLLRKLSTRSITRQNIAILALTLAITAVGAADNRARAQARFETQPIFAPTYLAIPPRQQEVITAAPSFEHVWVAGGWERTPESWTWSPGRWVKPPLANAYWVPGYWQHNSGQFVWQTGHWAVANQGLIVAKPVTLPPLYVEPQPDPPAGSLVWQPGTWDWRGTWVWVPGEYVQTTAPGAVWVAGQWEATTAGTWRWSPAHWAVS